LVWCEMLKTPNSAAGRCSVSRCAALGKERPTNDLLFDSRFGRPIQAVVDDNAIQG
jgi:hypothetical protein